MRSFVNLAALAFALSIGFQAAYAQELRACPSQIGNPLVDLSRAVKVGRWIQCEYMFSNGDGSSSLNYCFYNSDNSLAHYPNTPLRVDSSVDCPNTLPLASTYLLKPSGTLPGKCVTAASDSDGAAVTIQDCDYRHGNPGQKWTFKNSQIRMGNKCLDVKDGSTANGAKLQIWTCFDNNQNQQFHHSGDNVLTVPDDTISWRTHPGKCVDLTNGSQNNGNQIQMWDCFANNQNQVWFVAVTRP